MFDASPVMAHKTCFFQTSNSFRTSGTSFCKKSLVCLFFVSLTKFSFGRTIFTKITDVYGKTIHTNPCAYMHCQERKFTSNIFECWFLFLCLFYHHISSVVLSKVRKLWCHFAVQILKCRCETKFMERNCGQPDQLFLYEI